MKVLLAIPSYNRPYDIEKTTTFWLKKLVDIDWKVFIREEQEIYYSQILPDENIVTIDVSTYRETINEIGKYARNNGYNLVHRVDDDMSFKRLGQAKKKDVHKVYQELYKVIVKKFIQDPDLYGVSVSKPMNHIRNRDKTWNRENKCLYGNQWLRSEIMELPDGVQLFDDVYMSLLILKKGKKILSYVRAYEDSLIHKNSGGLQSIDRNKVSTETIKVMAEIFPNVRQGTYKGNKNIVDIDLKYLGIK